MGLDLTKIWDFASTNSFPVSNKLLAKSQTLVKSNAIFFHLTFLLKFDRILTDHYFL